MQKMTAILLLAFLALPAWSQVPASTSKSAQAKPAQAKSKPGTSKTQVAPKAEPETPMGPDELAIADRVHKGQLPCELGATVRLEADTSQPGYFYLHGKGFRYRMHPVATTTGAIRLEDRKAGAVWLQLANKSMLMDQKKGVRLADGCANTEQMVAARALETSKAPGLLDDPVAAPVGVATK